MVKPEQEKNRHNEARKGHHAVRYFVPYALNAYFLCCGVQSSGMGD
jgi:hypothetical protein